MMSYVTLEGKKVAVGKIVCIGQNYAKHARELNFDVPKTPVFFLKPPSAIIHEGGRIVLPSISSSVHHEVELTILLGSGGSAIAKEAALRHIAGYGVGLDMTMRDVQAEAKKQGLPWTLAKGFDTSAPISDFVPAQRIGNPSALNIALTVNGAQRQAAPAGEMVFTVETLIAYISGFITLEAGDILYMGTPEGVAQVEHGDVLEAVLKDEHGTILTSLHVSVQ